MKAAVATGNGLEVREIERLMPKLFQLLVKVKATGLNRADLAAASHQLGFARPHRAVFVPEATHGARCCKAMRTGTDLAAGTLLFLA